MKEVLASVDGIVYCDDLDFADDDDQTVAGFLDTKDQWIKSGLHFKAKLRP